MASLAESPTVRQSDRAVLTLSLGRIGLGGKRHLPHRLTLPLKIPPDKPGGSFGFPLPAPGSPSPQIPPACPADRLPTTPSGGRPALKIPPACPAVPSVSDYPSSPPCPQNPAGSGGSFGFRLPPHRPALPSEIPPACPAVIGFPLPHRPALLPKSRRPSPAIFDFRLPAAGSPQNPAGQARPDSPQLPLPPRGSRPPQNPAGPSGGSFGFPLPPPARPPPKNPAGQARRLVRFPTTVATERACGAHLAGRPVVCHITRFVSW